MALLQPKLSLRVAQRQVLTPGLMQMVSVLALNKLELKEMIDAEMVENPVLEELDEHVPLIDDLGGREAQMERPAEDLAADALRDKKDPFNEIDFGTYFQDYLDPGFRSPSNFEVSDKPSFEHFLSQPSTLTDHLQWQLGSLSLTLELRGATEYIAGNLNEDGYLTSTDEELLDGYMRERDTEPVGPLSPRPAVNGSNPGAQSPHLGPPTGPAAHAGHEHAGHEMDAGATAPAGLDHVRQLLAAALKIVQNLDPIGIATRDLRECLLVQIQAQRRGFELLTRGRDGTKRRADGTQGGGHASTAETW